MRTLLIIGAHILANANRIWQWKYWKLDKNRSGNLVGLQGAGGVGDGEGGGGDE